MLSRHTRSIPRLFQVGMMMLMRGLDDTAELGDGMNAGSNRFVRSATALRTRRGHGWPTVADTAGRQVPASAKSARRKPIRTLLHRGTEHRGREDRISSGSVQHRFSSESLRNLHFARARRSPRQNPQALPALPSRSSLPSIGGTRSIVRGRNLAAVALRASQNTQSLQFREIL